MSKHGGRVALKREAGVCINGPLPNSTRRCELEHGPVVRGGRCQRCIDVHDQNRTRRKEAKTHCRHGHELTPDNLRLRVEKSGAVRRLCRQCIKRNVDKARAPYTPLDELLSNARVRVLRALRWFDWVEVADLMEAVEAPDHGCTERYTITAAISKLVDRGDIERRKTDLPRVGRFWTGVMNEVRITKSGRARLSELGERYQDSIDASDLDQDDILEEREAA